MGTDGDPSLERLRALLGDKVLALACGERTITAVARWAQGSTTIPPTAVGRLHLLTSIVGTLDDPADAHDWLIAPHPRLDGRTPLQAFSTGDGAQAYAAARAQTTAG
jgi:hypothetical protein